MKRRNARGSYKWYKKESEENSMEGRGRSRRRNTHQAWKKRLSSVLAVVLTAVMILNMPLSIDGLRMHVSDAFASASNADRDSGVWATASNAKYRKGDSGDVDIYVIADDNGAVPGNTTSMTLYLKNNTDQAISEGVLTFSGRYINKEDAIFQDVGSGEEYEQIIAGGGPGQAGEESGEGLIYQESEETADETMAPDAAESIGSADEGIETADPVLPEDSGSEGDEEEEEAYKLTNIDLLPGELHEVHFEFYTDDDVKSTKANVSFSFRGENEEGSRVTGDTKFYYSIGLPTVNFSMEDGMQIESGISNDLEIWMSEPDWVDEDLQDRLDEQEEKEEKEEEENDAADTASDSDASKASDSNASKDDTASDSNAGKDSSTSQKDEEKIQKYTDEAMEISSSRVSYTVEIYGADYSEFHPRKAEEAEDIGWISCVYEVDRNTKPGIYYGKVTATGKWNKKSFTSEQGFLFEVTGEGWAGQEFTAELDAMTVHAYAEEGVLPEGVQLAVKELREDDAQTAEKFQEAVDALEQEGTAYDGMMAVDITFVDEDGQEIEPDGEVQVSIEMKKGALPEGVDLETVEIHHLKETDANTIEVEKVADGSDQTDGTVQTPEDAKAAMEEEAVPEERIEEAVSQDAEAVAAFSVDSFSTFTITWGGWGRTYFDITVHYVDQSGEGIRGSQDSRVPIGDGDTITFSEYAGNISGYQYLAAHYAEYSGEVITSMTSSQSYGSRRITFYNDAASVATLTYRNSTIYADVYLVYSASELSIRNDIINSGNLTAVPSDSISNQVSEYRWYRSEDGANWGDTPIEKINYAGGISNITGEKDANLNVSIDNWQQETTDSRYYYQVRAYDAEGNLLATSAAFLNPYYTELKNGSFETPDNDQNPKSSGAFEWTQDDYLAGGGVWQTTAEPDEVIGGSPNEIEILQTNKRQGDSTALKEYFGWGRNLEEVAPDGDQFAELNGGNAGALYQDVLTLEGQQLNYWLSHRARGNDNRETEFDTMYLVIMPTEVAVTNNLTTQDNLEDFLRSHGVENPERPYPEVAWEKVYDQDGIMIYRISSNDQDWHYFSGMDYVATSYLTRFFFVSGATAVRNNTEGNFLDEVGFSTDLPPIEENKGHLQITKIVNGLTDAERETYEVVLSGTPNGSDTLRDFETFSRDSVSYQNLDAGNSYTIGEQVQDTSLEAKYDVVTTVSVNGGSPIENDSVTISIVEDAVTTVTFTNTYTLKSGNLTVKKLVDGNMPDTTEQFDFVLTLKDGDELYTDDLYVDGVTYKYETNLTGYGDAPISGYVFHLSHNGEINFNIPYGYEWTVTEKPPVGYTGVSYVVDSGTSVQGEYAASGTVSDSSTVTFTNTKTVNTPTGIASEKLPYLMMLAIAAVGATSFIYPTCRRRRHKGDR